MKAALKPFLVLLVVAGIGLGITIYGGHKLGAAAVAKHKAAHHTSDDAKSSKSTDTKAADTKAADTKDAAPEAAKQTP